MGNLKKVGRTPLLVLFPAGLLLTYVSSFFPNVIEKFYSKGLFQLIGRILSLSTGIFPFSVGELIVAFFLLFIIGSIVLTAVSLTKGKRGRGFIVRNFFLNALALFSVAYFAFVIAWGLNYYRLPFAEIIHLNTQPASVQELAQVCESLIDRANKLRNQVDEGENGVMQIAHGTLGVFDRANQGYIKAARMVPELSGRFGKPKGVIFSYEMSYTGITGVYFPFTGEANVNTSISDAELPFTACHEMAHQRGFAREDEANYIAYLTCNLHPDVDFQYSGTLLALIHAMNMLQNYDMKQYNRLQKEYSDGVKRDLKFISRFWQKFEGPIESLSSNINDLYLKSNRQTEGVYSYNRMVDLLIAEYRRQKAGKKLR